MLGLILYLRNGQTSGLAMRYMLNRVGLSYMLTEPSSTLSWPVSIEASRRVKARAWHLAQNASQLRERP